MPSYSLGTLYLLPPSPWSHRVILAQRHLQCTAVKIREYKPMLTQLWLRLLGFVPWGTKVTAPLLFPADGSPAIMDSHSIARALDGRRSSNAMTLFPPKYDSKLRELVRVSETLACYGRDQMMNHFTSEPHIAAKFLFPAFFRWLPFVGTIAVTIARKVAAKFQPESDAAGEAQVRHALGVVDAAVKRANGNKFLLGGALTYADHVVASSLSFLLPSPAMEHFGFDNTNPLIDEYPETKKWVTKFIAEFVQKEHFEWPLQ